MEELPRPAARGLSRRDLLRASTVPLLLLARRRGRAEDAARELALRSLHTGESLSVVYYAEGRYVPRALDQLNQLLRDHRTGDVRAMDPRLFDLLHELRARADTRAPFEVISGYRSPRTNAMLRAQGRKVGSRSLHMEGQAIDVRLPDVPTERLRDLALELSRGGVGYYAKKGFVHVDVGRVRRW